jgi:hypothetical protein
MATFKMYNCDFGMKIGSTDYVFEHVNGFVIEDPEVTSLTRGANGSNKTGLVYKEGMKEAKTVTVTIMGMSEALQAVLAAAYKDKTRIEAVYSIDRTDGSSKMARNCVLSNQPQQLNLDDSPESMEVQLIFKSFDLSEVHKS